MKKMFWFCSGKKIRFRFQFRNTDCNVTVNLAYLCI